MESFPILADCRWGRGVKLDEISAEPPTGVHQFGGGSKKEFLSKVRSGSSRPGRRRMAPGASPLPAMKLIAIWPQRRSYAVQGTSINWCGLRVIDEPAERI